MTVFISTIDSTCGPLRCIVDEAGALTHIDFLDVQGGSHPVERLSEMDHEIKVDPSHTGEIESELKEYFAGERMVFDLDLAPSGTPFQRQVWNELKLIPYGETRSYGDIARAIGQPGASRAVGSASGANPIPIVIPCHRVVGSDGTLVGFASGLKNKALLLDMERRYWPNDDEDQLTLNFDS